MTQPVPEEAVVLRVGYDVAGVGLFLDALAILPDEIARISDAIAATPVGSTQLFAQRGHDMARAMIGGMQAELAGFTNPLDELIATRLAGVSPTSPLTAGLLDVQQLRELRAGMEHLISLRDRLRSAGEPLALNRHFSQATILGLDSAGVSAQRVTNEFARLNEQILRSVQGMGLLQGLTIPKSGLMQGARGDFSYRPFVERQVERVAGFADRPVETLRAFLPAVESVVRQAARTSGQEPSLRAVNEVAAQAVRQRELELQNAVAAQRQLLRLAEAAPTISQFVDQSRALPITMPAPAQTSALQNRIASLEREIAELRAITIPHRPARVGPGQYELVPSMERLAQRLGYAPREFEVPLVGDNGRGPSGFIPIDQKATEWALTMERASRVLKLQAELATAQQLAALGRSGPLAIGPGTGQRRNFVDEAREDRMFEAVARVIERIEARTGATSTRFPVGFDPAGNTFIQTPQFELPARPAFSPSDFALSSVTPAQLRATNEAILQRKIDDALAVGGTDNPLQLIYRARDVGQSLANSAAAQQRYYEQLLSGRGIPATIAARLPEEATTALFDAQPQELKALGRKQLVSPAGLMTREALERTLQAEALEEQARHSAIPLPEGPSTLVPRAHELALAEDAERAARFADRARLQVEAEARRAERERIAQGERLERSAARGRELLRRSKMDAILARDDQPTPQERAAADAGIVAAQQEAAERRRAAAADRAAVQREVAQVQLQAGAAPPLERGVREGGPDPAALVNRLRAAGASDADIRQAMQGLGFPAAVANAVSTPVAARLGGNVVDPQSLLAELSAARAAGRTSPGALHNLLRERVPDIEERRELIQGNVPPALQRGFDQAQAAQRHQLALEDEARAERDAAVAADRLVAALARAKALVDQSIAAFERFTPRLSMFARTGTSGDAERLFQVAGAGERQFVTGRGGLTAIGGGDVGITGPTSRELVETPSVIRNRELAARAALEARARVEEARAILKATTGEGQLVPFQTAGPLVRFREPVQRALPPSGEPFFTTAGPGFFTTANERPPIRQLFVDSVQSPAASAGGSGIGGRVPPGWPGFDDFDAFPGPGRPGRGGLRGRFETMRDEFMTGFRGRGDRPFTEQIGQTAKFSVLYAAMYGILFNVGQAFQAATMEALNFQDAVTSLNLITQRSTADNTALAESLGEVAAQAGKAPSEGVAAGAQAIGLFDLSQASAADQATGALVATRVAAQISRITGAPMEQVNTQLAGTARSFGLGAEDTPLLQDMATFISRRTGRPITDLLPAAANVGTLASGAGFSLAEVFATIGQITSTTGQTPLTAAGGLRQVLSRADDPAFAQKVTRQFGFDAAGLDLATIIKRVAATDPTQEQTNRFSLLFGRGSSQQAVQIMVRDQQRIAELARGADEAAGSGIGAEQFNQAMENVKGQVMTLGSTALELGKDLVNTGIVDFLVLLIKGAQATVDVLDDLVDVFNAVLPRELRSAVIGLGELVLVLGVLGSTSRAAVAASASRALGAILPFNPRFARAQTIVATPPARLTGLAAVRQGGAGVLGAGRGALGSIGGLVGGGALAGGALLAAGAAAYGALQAVRDRQVVAESAREAARSFAGATTATDLRSAAGRFNAAETEAEEAQRPRFGDIFNLGVRPLLANLGDSGIEQADRRARELSAKARAEADALDALDKRAAEATPASAFDFADTESVQTALQGLTDRSFDAAERVKALTDAFDLLVVNTGRAADAIGFIGTGQGETFAKDAAQVGNKAITDLEKSLQAKGADAPSFFDRFLQLSPFGIDPSDESSIADIRIGKSGRRGGGGGEDFSTRHISKEESAEFKAAADFLADEVLPNLPDPTKVSGEVLTLLKGRGKDTSAGPVSLNEGDQEAIREFIDAKARAALKPFLDSDIDEDIKQQALAAYSASIRANLPKLIGGFQDLPLTAANLQAFIEGIVPEAANVGKETTLRAGGLGRPEGDSLAGAEAENKVLTDLLAQVNGRIASQEFIDKTPEERADILRQRRNLMDQILASEGNLTLERRGRNQLDTANALAELDPRDVAGRLQTQIDQGRENLEHFRGTAEGRAAVVESIKQWEIEQVQFGLKAADLARQAATGAGDTVGQADNALRTANDALAKAIAEAAANPALQHLVDPLRIAANVAALADARARDAVNAAVGLDAIDPRDTLGLRAQQGINLRAARRTARDSGDTGEVARINQQLDQLAIEDANARLQRSLDERRATRAGIESPLVQARAAVQDAKDSLALQLQGQPEWANAYADLQEQKAELSKMEAASARLIASRAVTDMTDPVQVAAQAYDEAQALLAEAMARGEGGDLLSGLQENATSARLAQQSAAFQQEFSDLKFQEQMGTISHQQFLQTMQARRTLLAAELAGMQEGQDGYRQIEEQIQQFDLAIKSASDAMQGMFNLGDITVPTPFEVRRFLKADDTDPSLGGFGFNPTTTSLVDTRLGAPAVTDNRVVTININGGDLATVQQVVTESASVITTVGSRQKKY